MSSAEEQILQAAGIAVAVEGLPTVETFGSSKNHTYSLASEMEPNLISVFEDEAEESEIDRQEEPLKVKSRPSKAEIKMNLLKPHLQKFEELQINISLKLDKLLELKTRSIKMKEEEHAVSIAIKKVDLEIKTLQLEMLKN